MACAALPASGRLKVLEQRDIDRAIEVNLRAPIALAHALSPAMAARGRGHLVLIGSLSCKAATAGASVYCATKFGLRGFALGLRAELARSGVGVSLVVPGFVRDAGMFADTEIKLPPGSGTRPPQAVADAVARAIEHDRGEVTVASLPLALGAQVADRRAGLARGSRGWAAAIALALEFEERAGRQALRDSEELLLRRPSGPARRPYRLAEGGHRFSGAHASPKRSRRRVARPRVAPARSAADAHRPARRRRGHRARHSARAARAASSVSQSMNTSRTPVRRCSAIGVTLRAPASRARRDDLGDGLAGRR